MIIIILFVWHCADQKLIAIQRSYECVYINIFQNYDIKSMSVVFLVSFAGSEEERSRVDQVYCKILSWYTVGSKYM